MLRGAFDSPTVHSGGLTIPDGMLAVSVSMRVPAQVGGYVQPGTDVAVFDTFNLAEGKGRVPAGDGLASSHDYNQATRLLLPKVQVLAIGGRGTPGAATAPQPAASGATGGGGLGSSSGGGQSDTAEVLYKTTNFYYPAGERSILWNDPTLNIDWPLDALNGLSPSVSPKDSRGAFFTVADLPAPT